MWRRLLVLTGVNRFFGIMARTLGAALFLSIVGLFLQRAAEQNNPPQPEIGKKESEVIDAEIVE